MHTEQNQDVLELPMARLTGKERFYRALSLAVPLAILVFLAVGNSAPYFNYLGYAGVIIISMVAAYDLLTKVSHTYFNFRNKTIRRYFAHNPFRKFVEFNFDSFEVVLSEGVARVGTVTVKLNGRNGSIAIASFGPSNTFVTDDGLRLDHPEAEELRSYIAQRLSVRNLGAF